MNCPGHISIPGPGATPANPAVPRAAMPSAFGPYLQCSRAATHAAEGAVCRKIGALRSRACNISPPYRFTGGLGGIRTETGSYERGFAYRLDEVAHRLCPLGRARPHQPADGIADAGLPHSRTPYGARARAGAWRIEAGRHACLEYARRARLSAPREGPGRPAQRVRR